MKFLPLNSVFDFLPAKSKKADPTVIYELPVRFVRFKITDDTYEVLATNLPDQEFSAVELKRLYAMRWGIETSFRNLCSVDYVQLFGARRFSHHDQQQEKKTSL